MNVFSQLGVAVASTFDPKSFKKLHKVSAGGVALFFFFFAALILLCRYVFPLEIQMKKLGAIGNTITKNVPNFSYDNGSLEISSPFHQTYGENDEAIEILIDTDIDAFTSQDLVDLEYNDCKQALYFSKTNMMLKDTTKIPSKIDYYSYTELFDSLGIKSFDTEKFAKIIDKILRICIWIFYGVMLFVVPLSLIIFTLIGFAFAALIQAIINSEYTAGFLFKAGLYAQVPYLLLKSLNVMLGNAIPFHSGALISTSFLGWIGFIGGIVYIILVIALNGGEMNEENTYNYQNSYPIV